MTSSGLVLPASYSYYQVALSVFVSLLAAWATLEPAGWVTASRRPLLMGWATANGIGTWSRHFTGMPAFKLPVPGEYDWPMVLISFLPALFGSSVTLFVVSRRNVGGAGWSTLTPTP